MSNQNNMDNGNYLFYSAKDSSCYQLINTMKNNDLLKYFKLICTDPPNKYSNVAVPMISTGGKGRNTYIGNNAFIYINNMIQTNQINMMQMKMLQNNNYQQQASAFFKAKQQHMQSLKTKTIDFCSQEMSSSSDCYAFKDETNDASFPQNFVGITKDQRGNQTYDTEKTKICTAPESKDVDALKKKDTDLIIKKIDEQRKTQDKYTKLYNDDVNKKRLELANNGTLPNINHGVTGQQNKYFKFNDRPGKMGIQTNNSNGNNKPTNQQQMYPKPKLVNGKFR